MALYYFIEERQHISWRITRSFFLGLLFIDKGVYMPLAESHLPGLIALCFFIGLKEGQTEVHPAGILAKIGLEFMVSHF